MHRDVQLVVNSYIENLDESGLAEGDAEISRTSHAAKMSVRGSDIFLCYEEQSEGGKIFSDIRLCSDGITVSRRGAIESVLLFKDGEEFNTVYSVPPYKFDMHVKTLRIRSSADENGGEVDILYTMTVGGACKKCCMRLAISV